MASSIFSGVLRGGGRVSHGRGGGSINPAPSLGFAGMMAPSLPTGMIPPKAPPGLRALQRARPGGGTSARSLAAQRRQRDALGRFT